MRDGEWGVGDEERGWDGMGWDGDDVEDEDGMTWG